MNSRDQWNSMNRGEQLSIYVRQTAEKVASTKELSPDVVLADFDASGCIVGVELISLGPEDDLPLHSAKDSVE